MNGRTAKSLRRVARSMNIGLPRDWKAPLEGLVAKNPTARFRRRLKREWCSMSPAQRAQYRRDVTPMSHRPSHDMVHWDNLRTIPKGPKFYHSLNRAQRRALDHDQGVFEQRREEKAAEGKRLAAKAAKAAADKARRAKAKQAKLQDGKISLGGKE